MERILQSRRCRVTRTIPMNATPSVQLAADPQPKSLERSAPHGSHHTLPRPDIAIADPDATCRKALGAVFHTLNANLHEVHDGVGLAQLLADRQIDLVVTRSQLPRRSGVQVLAQQRARGHSLPFILVHSLQQPLMRIFVSDSRSRAVLAARTVDAANLAALVSRLLRSAHDTEDSRLRHP